MNKKDKLYYDLIEAYRNHSCKDTLIDTYVNKVLKLVKDYLGFDSLEKENKELIVNKNVAQAVAFDQKREIGELKDQLSYFKEESENWQSAYEWSQSKNAILKLENQELKSTVSEYKAQENLYWNTATNNVNLREENEKLKKAIEILKCFINYVEVEFDTFVTSQCGEEDYILLKEVFDND